GRAAGLALVFVCDEETGGRGAEIVFPEFAARGLEIESAVVGEPTGLDLAVAQKGMMVLELEESGDACHAAHARRLEAKNALIELARDLLALEELELGHEHAFLGRSTLVATVAKAGEARNRNPDFAHAVLDLRTVPGDDHEALHQLVRQTVRGTVHARSIRLRPCCIDADHDLVMDARALRPEARVFGSPTMSDWVFLGDVPALKCGPGQTDRSHVADEFVLASELDDGLDFYRRLAERRLNRN
ncbi:MAG: M20/M25/M40 family metallo-hydrolase, partial [Planctomycetes bacterium]|nr:M20/M25/M40 family metallo-hydrolase [Planctomycetota bacterium]